MNFEMENKEEISNTVLSITIPTWNRSEILRESLTCLLPEVIRYKSIIEIVISDNCSDDNTPNVINEFIEKYPQITIRSFRQESNTGYYGNFKKCKELATGKYFWLLSDNEFINRGIIEYLINILTTEKDISVVFLNDWGMVEDKIDSIPVYKSKSVDYNELFITAGGKITSTSAVIFSNNKVGEEIVFEKFKGNLFLGFGLLLHAMSSQKKGVIIYGTSLWSKYAQISFNVFEAFTIHLDLCINYGTESKAITQEIANNFVNDIIKDRTRWHYIKYKIYGKIYDRDFGTLDNIESLLKKYLYKYEGFNKYLRAAINTPRFLLIAWYYCYRTFKYFKK